MEIRKIGYITTALTIIISVVLFLIIQGIIPISTVDSSFTSYTFILFGLTAVLFFIAFCLLTNMEHQILAILDIAVGVLYAGAIIIYMFMPKEDAQNFFTILVYAVEIATSFIVISIPFIVRTQSNIHRYFKYLVAIFLVVASFLAVTSINSYVDILQSENTSLLFSPSSEATKKVKSVQDKIKVAEYIGFAGFIGIICNPMIGYASSDGLGGGSSSKTPKLVPRNTATDPNMSTGINTNQGINYGDLPVPEGVVASQEPITDPFQVGAVAPVTPVVPVTPEVPVTPVVPVTPAAPVASASPVSETPNVLNADAVTEALTIANPIPPTEAPTNPAPVQELNTVSPEIPNITNNNSN